MYAETMPLASMRTACQFDPTSDSGRSSFFTPGRKDSLQAQSGSSVLNLSEPTTSIHHGSARLKQKATTAGDIGWVKASSSQALKVDWNVVEATLFHRTTQAQRPGARDATIATVTLPPGSLQRILLVRSIFIGENKSSVPAPLNILRRASSRTRRS